MQVEATCAVYCIQNRNLFRNVPPIIEFREIIGGAGSTDSSSEINPAQPQYSRVLRQERSKNFERPSLSV
jgi:hypothetical protein